jgi:uncharacterized protein YndB with AHSA1/START domain
MSGTSSASAVRIRRHIAAEPELVFAAWLDPIGMARWLSPVGHAEAHVEPWVGGRLQVTMLGEGVRIEHTGEYRELIQGRRVVFTWRSPYTGPSASLVTVELSAVPGGTELTLVHEFLPADQVESHTGGWGAILARLASELTTPALEGQDR